MNYIIDAWKTHVAKEPSAASLSDCVGNEFTRKEVDELSDRVNGWLRSKGVGREDMVLINLERSALPAVAVLGIIKAGAAFTVVESSYASERIKFIREDCAAKAEIDHAAWQEILRAEPSSEVANPDNHDLCLMVYTSGTTGNPKGVIHEYGQLELEMLSERRPDGSFREKPKARWGLVAPLNFVASYKFLVHYYFSGGHLYVIDYDTVKNPKKLRNYFLINRIEGIFLSPTILKLRGGGFGPFVKYIYTGSEPANDCYVEGAELGNTYLMSESFFTVCKFIIDKAYPIVPIGAPTFDLKIKLLDERGREVAEGERGELCFENPYCRGYVGNPEANARHFINGWYHTGDLAECHDGVYTIKGRADDMVKIDGNRIEPSEIEAVCREELGLSSCAAKGFPERGFVALYFTDDAKIDEEEARKKLEHRLPYYMIPQYYIHIDHYPLSNSIKLDRKALEEPKDIYKEEYVAPRNEFEEALSLAFTQVLGVKDIGIKDDFFKLGGNSMKVMQLLDAMDEDDALTPTLIYRGRTIETISTLYKDARAIYMAPEQKEEEGKKNRYPLSRATSFYWNNVNDGSIDFYSCYQIIGFIPAGILAKGINKYIESNSTFNLVLEKGKDGVPVQVFREKAPVVRVERMSEEQARCEMEKFVRPFGYDEPLVRIRVLRTPFHTYLLFHAFHLVVDGASAHFMVEDMLNSIKGQQTEKVLFFSYAFEENIRDRSPLIEGNREWFEEHYSIEEYDYCIKCDDKTGQTGHADTRAAKIPLATAQACCERDGISMQCFISSAALWAQAGYNGTDGNNQLWNYHNRGPKDTHAGVLVRCAAFAIHASQINSPKDLYNAFVSQNEELLWRLHDRNLSTGMTTASPTPTMYITYLEDWFSKPALPSFLGKEIPLKNTSPEKPQSEKVFRLTGTHDGKDLSISLNYGKSFLKEESAERYISMLEYSMKQLAAGRLPDLGTMSQM